MAAAWAWFLPSSGELVLGVRWPLWPPSVSDSIKLVSIRTERFGAASLFPDVHDPGSEGEETSSHPGRVSLNFNFVTILSRHFPSVVSDEGVEFISAGGTWQFERPLACLGGQPEMFK